MINHIYQLVSPHFFSVSYADVNLNEGVIVRPDFMSICHADQRYYLGTRDAKVLGKKLPMALIEGYEMPLPCDYDTYLKTAFGEYLKLPPKGKRVPHHDVVFCDLNNSYKKYKGKYYCVEGEK